MNQHGRTMPEARGQGAEDGGQGGGASTCIDDYESMSPAERRERQGRCRRAFAQLRDFARRRCVLCGKEFTVEAPGNPNLCFGCGDTDFEEGKVGA